MSLRIFILSCCLLITSVFAANGQSIKGAIVDMENNQPLKGVDIRNIHTGFTMTSDEKGDFFITASGDQLIEFRLMGYKTTRVRIPNGTIPPYFKIMLQKGAVEMPAVDLLANLPEYQRDSIIFYQLYKHELNFPKMSTLDVIQHPFSALSKRSQEIWAFQDDYNRTQQEKYIDFTFNDKMVTSLTGLPADSARMYVRRYRPTYQQLRSMNEYTLYNFIKRTVAQYRSNGGHSNYRNAQ